MPKGKARLEARDSASGRTSSNPQFRVLLGINEEAISKLVTEILESVTRGKYALRLAQSERSSELLSLASAEPFDLFVLLLNNIIHSEPPHSPGEGLANSLDLLDHLRRTTGKPIVALSGLPADVDRVKAAGASIFFQFPVNPDDLKKAIEECLKQIESSHHPAEK